MLQVSPNHFYRVWANVSRAAQDRVASDFPPATAQRMVEQAVDCALQTQGFAPAEVVIQDPTSRNAFTIVAKYVGGGTPGPADDFAITNVQEVAPPPPVVFPLTQKLDIGLTDRQIAAAQFALESDSDPTRLSAYAETLDVDFPILAALVHAKANLETTSRQEFTGPALGPGTPSPLVDALQAASIDLGKKVVSMWGDYRPTADRLPPPPPPSPVPNAASVATRLDRSGPYRARAIAVGRAISFAVRNPELVTAPVRESEGLPQMAARSAVFDAGGGVGLVDANAARTLLPLGPAPVSKGAIKILCSSLKPQSTGIFDPSKVRSKVLGAKNASPDGKTSLERAQQLLNRHTWTNYYIGMRDSGLM